MRLRGCQKNVPPLGKLKGGSALGKKPRYAYSNRSFHMFHPLSKKTVKIESVDMFCQVCTRLQKDLAQVPEKTFEEWQKPFYSWSKRKFPEMKRILGKEGKIEIEFLEKMYFACIILGGIVGEQLLKEKTSYYIM